MKKFISWLLALADDMLACSLRCTPRGRSRPPSPPRPPPPAPGLDASAKASYTGKAAGNNGELSVRVDVEDGRITKWKCSNTRKATESPTSPSSASPRIS